MIETALHPLKLPLAEAESGGWVPYPLFKGKTASLDFMGCHVSVLSPGCSPHPPHSHIEEELLIVLDGDADIVIANDPDDPRPRVERMRPGQFSYYPAWQHHTIRNASASPITYMMFKWTGAPVEAVTDLATGTYDCRELLAANDARSFAPKLVFESPTGWLRRLHCHVTRLKPGGGYEAHADAYDVAIVLLSGKIETLGQVMEDSGVVYYSAGMLHGMRNPGSEVARYLVFEFDTASMTRTR